MCNVKCSGRVILAGYCRRYAQRGVKEKMDCNNGRHAWVKKGESYHCSICAVITPRPRHPRMIEKMRNTSDVKKDKIELIQKKDDVVMLLEKTEFPMLLKNKLRETIEAYYKPMLCALDIECAIREDVEA